jgi:hypothetical protein
LDGPTTILYILSYGFSGWAHGIFYILNYDFSRWAHRTEYIFLGIWADEISYILNYVLVDGPIGYLYIEL